MKTRMEQPGAMITEYCQCSRPDDFSYVVLKNCVHVGVCLSNTMGMYEIYNTDNISVKI